MKKGRALEAPRNVDAQLAAADDDDDAAVADVGPATGSREPTPPPSPTLAAIVAERVANGESVGVNDDDTLLEPAGGEPAGLNVDAAVEGATRRREKQVAYVKTTVKAKTGGSDTGDKRTKPKKDSDTSETDIELDQRPVTKRRRSPKTVNKPTKRTKPIEVADSDEDDVSKGATRYKSIKSSYLVKKWDGPTLHELRRDFQRRVLARDGFPPKCTHGNQEANYKLVLLTAKSCMDPTLFKSFKADLEAAHSSKDKE